MRPYVSIDQIAIDKALYDFVNREAMPGTGVAEGPFWSGFARLVRALAPRNALLLQRRDELQSKIDSWHKQYPGASFDHARYKSHLLEIGYLLPHGAAFAIDTAHVDPEIAQTAGPDRSWWCRSAMRAMR